MSEYKILFIDTETGGLDPNKNSLLSIGLVVWDNGTITDSLEILINDGRLDVTEYAIKVNKIDIEYHKIIALNPSAAINRLNDFIASNFDSKKPVTLAGHNVGFDVAFLKRFYQLNGLEYNKQFSHRVIDTSSILQFLYYSEILQENISSSDAAFNYFSIPVEKRHSALGDARATAELFNRLRWKVRHN